MNAADHAAIAEIYANILSNVAAGMPFQSAFDAVMGEGAHAKLAGEVYDALRK